MSNAAKTPARRGRPRRVDRARIIEAARALDPDTLTMQAVADEIGVDRKTLHYHVSDRTTLLQMVAADTFRRAVANRALTQASDWREALQSFGDVTRQAVIAAGAWASYVNFESTEDLEAAQPAEAVVKALIKAGISELQAGRVVATVAVLAFASARDHAASNGGQHPQDAVLAEALKHAPLDEFALLRRLIGGRFPSLGSEEQFQFELQLLILGVERLLEMAQA
ncbi:TetR/AcrR family transcriptional regulator C-terminal domain-containing protein [Mycobacterium sp. OAE908]|uniref:TetR/AcrR family transcriptional regulator n=1 Tax=Mycobacterium sp. OAE908 TaxID=2817899 RepID=UPI001AE715BB